MSSLPTQLEGRFRDGRALNRNADAREAATIQVATGVADPGVSGLVVGRSDAQARFESLQNVMNIAGRAVGQAASVVGEQRREAESLQRGVGASAASEELPTLLDEIQHPEENAQWRVPDGMEVGEFVNQWLTDRTGGMDENAAKRYREVLAPRLTAGIIGQQREIQARERRELAALHSEDVASSTGGDQVREVWSASADTLPHLTETERADQVLAPGLKIAADTGNVDLFESIAGVLGEHRPSTVATQRARLATTVRRQTLQAESDLARDAEDAVAAQLTAENPAGARDALAQFSDLDASSRRQIIAQIDRAESVQEGEAEEGRRLAMQETFDVLSREKIELDEFRSRAEAAGQQFDLEPAQVREYVDDEIAGRLTRLGAAGAPDEDFDDLSRYVEPGNDRLLARVDDERRAAKRIRDERDRDEIQRQQAAMFDEAQNALAAQAEAAGYGTAESSLNVATLGDVDVPIGDRAVTVTAEDRAGVLYRRWNEQTVANAATDQGVDAASLAASRIDYSNTTGFVVPEIEQSILGGLGGLRELPQSGEVSPALASAYETFRQVEARAPAMLGEYAKSQDEVRIVFGFASELERSGVATTPEEALVTAKMVADSETLPRDTFRKSVNFIEGHSKARKFEKRAKNAGEFQNVLSLYASGLIATGMSEDQAFERAMELVDRDWAVTDGVFSRRLPNAPDMDAIADPFKNWWITTETGQQIGLDTEQIGFRSNVGASSYVLTSLDGGLTRLPGVPELVPADVRMISEALNRRLAAEARRGGSFKLTEAAEAHNRRVQRARDMRATVSRFNHRMMHSMHMEVAALGGLEERPVPQPVPLRVDVESIILDGHSDAAKEFARWLADPNTDIDYAMTGRRKTDRPPQQQSGFAATPGGIGVVAQ